MDSTAHRSVEIFRQQVWMFMEHAGMGEVAALMEMSDRGAISDHCVKLSDVALADMEDALKALNAWRHEWGF